MTDFNVSEDYDSPVIKRIIDGGYKLETPRLTICLAREFGFCYGVRRAIELAYAARRERTGTPLRLTAEIIHNPQVNARMREMGIEIPDRTAPPLVARAGDTIIIPAFGLPVARERELRATGATLIDTTCGSVKQVWRRVETLARDGFTVVIHGNPKHEETLATASRAANAGGRYIIIRDMARARVLADVIKQTVPFDPAAFGDNTLSDAFDPATDLRKIGMANQTTMLKSESIAIAELLRDAITARDGDAAHFRNFETICPATQDRQDAVKDLARRAPDLVLVIGGFNSSNTTHLAELAAGFAPTYHIESDADLRSAAEIRCLPVGDAAPVIAAGVPWLPSPPKHVTIGVTAGASTPDKTIGRVIERCIELAERCKTE